MDTMFVVVGAIFVAGGAYLVRRAKVKKASMRLKSRQPMSEDEIYAKFYAARNLDRLSVLALWREVAEALHVPAGCMRPDDRFGREIGTFFITSEDLDTLSALAARHAKQKGLAVNLSSITTVDQYIETFAPKV